MSQWEYVKTLLGAKSVLKKAIKEGATRVNTFDGFLPEYYKQFGFKETSRAEWDDARAPKNWNYEENNRPEVVYMELKGG